jgi:hypothetical protein
MGSGSIAPFEEPSLRQDQRPRAHRGDKFGDLSNLPQERHNHFVLHLRQRVNATSHESASNGHEWP